MIFESWNNEKKVWLAYLIDSKMGRLKFIEYIFVVLNQKWASEWERNSTVFNYFFTISRSRPRWDLIPYQYCSISDIAVGLFSDATIGPKGTIHMLRHLHQCFIFDILPLKWSNKSPTTMAPKNMEKWSKENVCIVIADCNIRLHICI